MSSFSANGSPTWTLGRFDGSSSVNVALARTDAPPIPSRPVVEPNRTTRLPGPGAAASVRRPLLEQADGHHVDQRVALVARVEDELAADRRHADAVAVAADAADDAVDEVARPRRRPGRRTAARRGPRSGRAPIVKMSRRMPPTPVAAPWYGSTARRVVVRLDLERDREPVADRDDAGVLARAGDDALAGGRQRPQQRLRALVRAVLAPHDAEHRQLEVVRVAAAEPVADRVELVVGDAEPAMERLHRALGHGHRRADRDGDRRLVGAPRGALDQRADDPEPVVRAEDRLRRRAPGAASARPRCRPRSSRRRSPAASRSGWPRSSGPAASPAAST